MMLRLQGIYVVETLLHGLELVGVGIEVAVEIRQGICYVA